jgi:hypothetical protein
MTTYDAVLSRALSGDATALDGIDDPSGLLEPHSVRAPSLRLSSGAVAAVLKDYVAGRISETEAQRWAALMRWGHLPSASREPIRPLDIEFDPTKEDAIVECLARLDELGDVIDGRLRDGEAEELLRALRS